MFCLNGVIWIFSLKWLLSFMTFVQIAVFDWLPGQQKGLIYNKKKNVQNLLRNHKIVDFGNYCHFKYFIIDMSQNVFKAKGLKFWLVDRECYAQ